MYSVDVTDQASVTRALAAIGGSVGRIIFNHPSVAKREEVSGGGGGGGGGGGAALEEEDRTADEMWWEASEEYESSSFKANGELIAKFFATLTALAVRLPSDRSGARFGEECEVRLKLGDR